MRTAFRAAFEVLDADHDGKISGDDLRKFYAGIGGDGAATSDDQEMIRSMMWAADTNEDGFVEYDEFEKVVNCGRKGEWDVMEEVFRVLDKDGDGKVGHDDLKICMRLAGFDVRDDDIEAMIGLGGADETEGVTYDALLKILAV